MVLILYHQKPRVQREAISKHLLSFGKDSELEVEYWNVAFGLPPLLSECGFDAVLFHFTFFLPNINRKFDDQFENWGVLKRMQIPKAALVQDEYINTSSICRFFKEFEVETVFTCLPPDLYQTVYPTEYSGLKNYYTVLTGYIDDDFVREFGNKPIGHDKRKFDVVYRARKMPYNLGVFGTYKWKLTEIFENKNEEYNLKLDVSNDPNSFIFGSDWYKFVGNSRLIIGSEGGSSLHDPEGTIRACCDKLMLSNPNLSFDEVKSACFGDEDEKFPYYAISPRHFEAAVLRTCQVLIEGNYNGVLKPNIHYIPIKKDFSNLDQVFSKMKDVHYCEAMAERTFDSIVQSGDYTYDKFVQFVLSTINDQAKIRNRPEVNKNALHRLKLLKRYPYIHSPINYLKLVGAEMLKRIVWKTGWDKKSWFKKIEFYIHGRNAVR
ncbi:MAG: hypothetical protein IPL55_02845 [Saprospiraceae bacterium]|jgi:hypothetical protein|nr:hypothetical protein [Saprospiraceae bacterium]